MIRAEAEKKREEEWGETRKAGEVLFRRGQQHVKSTRKSEEYEQQYAHEGSHVKHDLNNHANKGPEAAAEWV